MSNKAIETAIRAQTSKIFTQSTILNRNKPSCSSHRLSGEPRPLSFASIANQRSAFSKCPVSRVLCSRREVLAKAEHSGIQDVLHQALGDPLEPEEVLRQAANGIKHAMQFDPVNICEVAGFVDTLLSTPSPFSEEKLGGGPWQVVYSRGPLLWQGWSAPGKVVNMKNVASQDFRPEDRTAVNKAEVFGGKVFVTASGSYCPDDELQQQHQKQQGNKEGEEEEEDQVQQTPVKINVSIVGGQLHWFGRTIGLPFIKGKGSFNVMYVHDDVRVLRNGDNANSGLVVQIRQEVLPELCSHHLK